MKFGRLALALLGLGGAALAGLGCSSGGGGATPQDAGGDTATGPADGEGGSDGNNSGDVPVEAPTDVLGEPRVDPPTCPTAATAFAPADPSVLIDDFDGTGALKNRRQTRADFSVRETFDATVNAQFSPPPAVEPTCGAAALGAGHIAGMATDAGAFFAIEFSSGAGLMYYDASGTKGLTFRAALGKATASATFGLRVDLFESNWAYAKDITIKGTSWETIQILWTELDQDKPPLAPAFVNPKIRQIVLPLISGAEVDLFLDDIAFIK